MNDLKGALLSGEPQMLEVSLVSRSGAAALTGHYLTEMFPNDAMFTGLKT